MAKLVKLFIIFGPVPGNQVKVIKKYTNTGHINIDEQLTSTLCLPRIEYVDSPRPPRFQTFLVTKEDGQVLYGSGLIVYDQLAINSNRSELEINSGKNVIQKQDLPTTTTSKTNAKTNGFAPKSSMRNELIATNNNNNNHINNYPNNLSYVSQCYTIITDTPFIHATKSLLHLIWDKRCDDNVIRAIMNIPLPTKRTCIRIELPSNNGQQSRLIQFQRHFQKSKKLTKHNLVNQFYPRTSPSRSSDNQNANSPLFTPSNRSNERSFHQTTNYQQAYIPLDDIYLCRGMSDLPLLDYPLRELFSFMQIDDLLLAFTCLLMEFRTLIISQDNYKLMMVGEALTTLLLPLKWCNVYVPILPPDYGASYLDAPTSYIMGINTQVTDLPENLNHVQCRIYCDENRVICDADSLTLPPFLNDLKRDISEILENFSNSHNPNKPLLYLDDLKFNRAIRLLFIQTVRKNILANYERYIVDVSNIMSEIREFDVVSYLSDQPEFMHNFLSRFLDTQLFASFIDENSKRMQQSWLSIFDMDHDELSDHFTDEALELAFKNAQCIQLKNLIQNNNADGLEIKTVPASPVRLPKRAPALLESRLNLGLIHEVKDLTKQILIQAMEVSNNSSYNDDGISIGNLCDLIERVWAHGAFISRQDNSVAWCPLWNHLTAFARLKYLDSKQNKRDFFDNSQLNVLSNPISDAASTRRAFSYELDMMQMQNNNIFRWFKTSKRPELGSLARDLINDLIIVNKLEDVKTGVGKARAFIRLSLEKKKLSKHLKTLISDQELLSSLYKPYAFLLHEDEREQFLMYLLTLNAVDLPCFTTTFVNVIKTRRQRSSTPFTTV